MSSDTGSLSGKPVVFVSYAQESRSHSAAVARLCEFLADRGVEPHYDQQQWRERIDWEDWTNNEFQAVDYVLVIASPAYRDIGANRFPSHRHRGLRSEYRRLVDLQHENGDTWTRKILPVVLPGRAPDEIPRSFRPFTTTYYQVTSFTDEGAADLLGVLLHPAETGVHTRQEPDRRGDNAPAPGPPRPDRASPDDRSIVVNGSAVIATTGDIGSLTINGDPRAESATDG